MKQKVDSDGDVKIIRLPYKLNILNKLRKHAKILSYFQKEKPDLIFVHGIHLNLKEAIEYKKQSGCKVILDYHADYNNSANNWFSLNVLHKIIRKNFFDKYVNYIDQIYPITPSCQKFLHEVYEVDNHLMEVLPLGCDYLNSTDVLNNTDSDVIKKELSIPNDSFIIITGGKLNPTKKTDIILDALNILADKNIHLIVFGKANSNDEYYEENLKFKSMGLNVHFTGWLTSEEILKLMSVANIAIYIDSPSVLWQQSIGMHLPLILGDTGHNCVEYLNLHSNIINLGRDITSINLAKQIVRLKNEQSELHQMKEGAKKVAEDYLDYRIICSRTLDIIE